jgi:hypothetical protein
MALLKLRGAAILVIGLVVEAACLRALAQLPPSNPAVAPLPAPSGPAQLPAPVTTLVAPALVSVPTLAAASPTPGPQVFNCSCAGPGHPTSWMGQVDATGFFAARQAATGACLTYNQRREPAPPDIASHQSAAGSFAPAATLPQGFENPNLASTAGSTYPGTLTTSSAGELEACSQCACD